MKPLLVRSPLILRTAALAMIGLLAPLSARAQEPVEAPVQLDSLLSIVLAVNPGVRSSEAAHLAARERIPQAGALPDPMLEVISEGAPLDRPTPSRARMTRIGVSQMFMFPGKQGAMKAEMAAMASASASEVEQRRLQAAADLVRAFADLYLAHAALDVLEDSRTTMRSMTDAARVRYEVGRAMQPDLLKANVELAVETNEIVMFRARIAPTVARLNAVLGRPADAPIGRPVPPPLLAPARGDVEVRRTAGGDPGAGDAQTPSAEGGSSSPEIVEELTRRALGRAPMLAMRESEVEARRARLRLARKTGLPDFTVGAEYMAEKDMDDTVTGMLGMTLPIWRWNKVAPARREAEQELRAAEGDAEQARADVAAMVREAWSMHETSRALVELYRDSVLPQAEQALASTRIAYETDRVDFMSLLDAQRSLLQARLRGEQAIADHLKSRAELALAVGDIGLLGVNATMSGETR